MSDSEKKSVKISNIAIGAMGLLLVAMTVVAAVPSWSQSVRSIFFKKYRVLLAKTTGNLDGHGLQVVVIKVKTEMGLRIEVYHASQNNDPDTPMAAFDLDEKRDSHMNFRGKTTNLALTDLDGDGWLEIIAPSYDDNLIPRLNVFKFDPETKTFAKMSTGS
jgi:hypothetical protein